MRHALLRNILLAGPAVLAYAFVVPLAARAADRRCQLSWPLPEWTWIPGLLLIAAGAVLALWTVWLFGTIGAGTPNPLAPPRHLVARGPYRVSRNPMMLGGWVAGFGLALALGSPSLVGALATIVVAGCLYVRYIEEPRLRQRFGIVYSEYAARVPRWFGCPIRGACGLSHHSQNG
jgi:protein-S-isoprenylcysteine O-methyltransferase Ste14